MRDWWNVLAALAPVLIAGGLTILWQSSQGKVNALSESYWRVADAVSEFAALAGRVVVLMGQQGGQGLLTIEERTQLQSSMGGIRGVCARVVAAAGAARVAGAGEDSAKKITDAALEVRELVGKVRGFRSMSGQGGASFECLLREGGGGGVDGLGVAVDAHVRNAQEAVGELSVKLGAACAQQRKNVDRARRGVYAALVLALGLAVYGIAKPPKGQEWRAFCVDSGRVVFVNERTCKTRSEPLPSAEGSGVQGDAFHGRLPGVEVGKQGQAIRKL